jgi:N-acyl-D-aspartate/D-glutamate deacylase
MGTFDIVIRGGTVVDGTGAAPRRADVAIVNDHIVDIATDIVGSTGREIDATGRLVTPGFVDIHTHLDAQLAWDPIGSSSCWHGVTSVVMGNCGVTFAPCRPEDRAYLAELMESVEDIPRNAILDGLAWDWVTYGEYLASMGRLPKGPNVGGMVGHSAIRHYVMGERGLDPEPATPEDIVAMAELLDEAMLGGALGFSTSRTFLHKVPDGRPVPGTYATEDELYAFADVLGRHGVGVFESASRIGERDLADGTEYPKTRAELAWMGEVSRRSGRPVSFGLTQHDSRPDLYQRVIDFAKNENATGAVVRPQTTARSVGILFSLDTRTVFDRSPAWRELRGLAPAVRLCALRDSATRRRLIDEADENGTGIDLDQLFVVTPLEAGGSARYDLDPELSIGGIARHRGISGAAAFIELLLETDGTLVCSYPFLNQRLDAVEAMLDDPLVTLGLADAGAHVGQILDASQPTFFLSYWIRDRKRWSIEEGVRRLTSDTADLFGIRDRGRLVPGAFADVNVIDFDALQLPAPSYVYDFPHGAGRYVQGAVGYDYTLVNGQVFMDHGEHTGVLAGQLLRGIPV